MKISLVLIYGTDKNVVLQFFWLRKILGSMPLAVADEALCCRILCKYFTFHLFGRKVVPRICLKSNLVVFEVVVLVL